MNEISIYPVYELQGDQGDPLEWDDLLGSQRKELQNSMMNMIPTHNMKSEVLSDTEYPDLFNEE